MFIVQSHSHLSFTIVNYARNMFTVQASAKLGKFLRSYGWEQHTLKNVNILNTNIYSHLETSGGESCNLYLNVVYFFNTSVY
jgi:hypothetical protein